MERMIVAAIQLDVELGDVERNFAKAIEMVGEAAAKRARLIVLPEFFTSAMALNPAMEDVARRNMGLDIPGRFRELSSRHGCIIAGSYLNIIAGEIYNSMLLQFPDGDCLIHNKDLPTQFENRYYTKGDCLRGKNRVGVALCWEMLRSQTIRGMPLDIRILAAGSCWWDPPEQVRDEALRDYNHRLNRETPARLAALLAVPVVHAAHAGMVNGARSSVSETFAARRLIGRTQIIDHTGRVLSELDPAAGDAVLKDEIELAGEGTRPETPEGYWTVELPPSYLEAWERENIVGPAYYIENRARMIGIEGRGIR